MDIQTAHLDRSPTTLRSLLDDAARALRTPRGTALAAARELVRTLAAVRAGVSIGEWKALAAELRAHPIADLVRDDPYTARAIAKPRGYPGDAPLLDFVYQHPDAAEDVARTSETGRAVYAYTAIASAGARAVRERRDRIAARIDELACARDGARVLAFACGHLREAELSVALAGGRVAELLAADADPETVAKVGAEWEGSNVRAVRCSVKRLMTGGPEVQGTFDLVYALGLYDYLDDAIGAALLTRFLEHTKPGGSVIVANFTTEFDGAAYMETFMDWWLVYRDEPRMRALADAVPAGLVADVRVTHDTTRSIVTLEVVRA